MGLYTYGLGDIFALYDESNVFLIPAFEQLQPNPAKRQLEQEEFKNVTDVLQKIEEHIKSELDIKEFLNIVSVNLCSLRRGDLQVK